MSVSSPQLVAPRPQPRDRRALLYAGATPFVAGVVALAFATLSLDEQPNGNGNPASDYVADSGPSPEEILQAKERENAIQQALDATSRHRTFV